LSLSSIIKGKQREREVVQHLRRKIKEFSSFPCSRRNRGNAIRKPTGEWRESQFYAFVPLVTVKE